MQQDPFFMVWNEGGNAPRVKHDNLAKAEREAERLAKLYPAQSFIVLAAVSRFTERRVTVERFLDLDCCVPF